MLPGKRGCACGAAHILPTTKESEMSSPAKKTVFVFNSYGMGQTADAGLKLRLAKKFLALLADADPLPAQLCFYTDGVKLCVNDSPVLDELRALAGRGVALILCFTC